MIWSPVPVPVTYPVEFPAGRHNLWYSLGQAKPGLQGWPVRAFGLACNFEKPKPGPGQGFLYG